MKILGLLVFVLATIAPSLAINVETRARGATSIDATHHHGTRRLKGSKSAGTGSGSRDSMQFYYLISDRENAIINNNGGYTFSVDIYIPGSPDVRFERSSDKRGHAVASA